MFAEKNFNLVAQLSCPICGDSESQLVSLLTSLPSKLGYFSVRTCSKCNFSYTNPRVSSDELSKLYDRNEAHGMSIGDSKGIVFKLRLRRHKNYSKDFIGNNEKQILDYGCGDGVFIKNIAYLNDEVKCYAADFGETAPLALNDAKRLVTYFPGRDLAKIGEKFDLIFLRHVLEHVPNPFKFINELLNHLNPGGKIVVEVPNYNSVWRSIFGKYWSLLGINRREGPVHYNHFTEKSINNLFNKNLKIYFAKSNSMNVLGPSLLNYFSNYSQDHNFSFFSVLLYPVQALIEKIISNKPVLIFSLELK